MNTDQQSSQCAMSQKQASLRALILLSGGIDSAAVAHFLKKDYSVEGLFVDYGQAARDIENSAARAVAALLDIKLSTASVASTKAFTVGEIPARNGLLAMLALSLCGYDYDAIAMGLHSGTPYYDCSPAFADRLDVIIREYSAGRTRFFSPFLHWSKNEVYQYCQIANLDLSVTYSCKAGTLPPCGKCSSCLDRANLDVGQDAQGGPKKRSGNPNAAAATIIFEQGSSERERR
jgi:7-cyano-7-deazaguanine synthase